MLAVWPVFEINFAHRNKSLRPRATPFISADSADRDNEGMRGSRGTLRNEKRNINMINKLISIVDKFRPRPGRVNESLAGVVERLGLVAARGRQEHFTLFGGSRW